MSNRAESLYSRPLIMPDAARRCNDAQMLASVLRLSAGQLNELLEAEKKLQERNV